MKFDARFALFAFVATMVNADSLSNSDTAAAVDNVGQIKAESIYAQMDKDVIGAMNASEIVGNVEGEVDDSCWSIEGLGTDFGVAQDIDVDGIEDFGTGSLGEENLLALIAKTKIYMDEVVMVEEKYAEVREVCLNYSPMCTIWAAAGECEENPEYMNDECAPVCQSCDKIDLTCGADAEEADTEEDSSTEAAGEDEAKVEQAFQGEVDEEEEEEEDSFLEGPGDDFGVGQSTAREDFPQDVPDLTEEKVLDHVKLSAEYMEIVMKDETFAPYREKCLNTESMCTIWAVTGECATNPDYMLGTCAPACFSCDKIELETEETASEEIVSDEAAAEEPQQIIEEAMQETVDEQTEDEDEEDMQEAVDEQEEDEDEEDTQEAVDGQEEDEEDRGLDFGAPQLIDPEYAHEEAAPMTEEDAIERIKLSKEYMDLVMKDDKFAPYREVCWNYYVMCTIWAVTGECDLNPEFMLDECAPACFSCDKITLDAEEIEA